MILIYIVILALLSIFSYGFVDANFSYQLLPEIFKFIHAHRGISTWIYVLVVIGLFGTYFWFLGQAKIKKISVQNIWKVIILSCLILIFSFPAFSYDIFNYIATAKLTFFYKENPYIVMPIEIPNEPLLSFMHASNKTALYGPVWITLTMIPHVFGSGYVLLTIFFFKFLTAVFFLWCSWLILQMSGKNIRSLVFFALNPLVLIETLVSGHNDVVMMAFALGSFWLLSRKKILPSLFFFIFSIGIKFGTLALLPVWIYCAWQLYKRKIIVWQKVYLAAAIFLFAAFLVSPLREEMYPWYLIWPLSFVALIDSNFIRLLTISLSFGLSLRFAPFIYFGMWGGWVPAIKKLVTIGPTGLTGLYYAIRKKI